ncbi:MAG TPA: DUF305 domain-containing protein [Acidimicrobiia bacterium]
MTTQATLPPDSRPSEPPDAGRTTRGWRPSWPPPLPQAIALVLGLVLLAGVVGWRLNEDDRPARDSVDVGFLDDMQLHHAQGLEIAYAYLEHGSNETLRHIARDIVTWQGMEIGLMRGILERWGYSDDPNDSNLTHEWLGTPVPAAEMPGMADPDDITRLSESESTEADDLFTALMIPHHLGGIHMADYAADHAGTARVRELAGQMVQSQGIEVEELDRIRLQLGLEPIEDPE